MVPVCRISDVRTSPDILVIVVGCQKCLHRQVHTFRADLVSHVGYSLTMQTGSSPNSLRICMTALSLNIMVDEDNNVVGVHGCMEGDGALRSNICEHPLAATLLNIINYLRNPISPRDRFRVALLGWSH